MMKSPLLCPPIEQNVVKCFLWCLGAAGLVKCICVIVDRTFCCVENSSRFSTASLPVDAVGQRADKILLRALHDLLTHLMELLGVVDSAIKLGIGIRKFYKFENRRGYVSMAFTDVLKSFKQTSFQSFKSCDVTQSYSCGNFYSFMNLLEGKNVSGRNTHGARCVDSGSVSSVYPSSQHPLHNREKSEAFYFTDNIGMFKNICEQSCYLLCRSLRGSASTLLRLCCDEADSLGLAGLLLARLSPALRRKPKDVSSPFMISLHFIFLQLCLHVQNVFNLIQILSD